MLDRASTFAHPDIVRHLTDAYIPVAIDQAYQRRQQDAEGRFYRKIAGQSPRNDFKKTTQGFYAATSGGALLFYNNNRDPDKVARLLARALNAHEEGKEKETLAAAPIADGERDARYSPTPPAGGLVVRVHAKVLGGYPEETENRWTKIFQSALGRDNLWITKAEHDALVAGEFPNALLMRLARFHLVDNTRGEPPMWKPEELRDSLITFEDGVVKGKVLLETADGKRRYEASLYGVVEMEGKQVRRFDLVADGLFEGGGRFTRNPPPGKFPFAVSFTLADGSEAADAIPPQGSRGWVEGYFR